MRVPTIRKNDIVYVRQGKDKGKTGKVLEVNPETRRALVEHMNTVKAFIKQDRSKNVQGGIMEREAPIPLSRLMLYCAECGQGIRARLVRHEDGTKSRVCPKCDTTLEVKK
jgi:large subunit ribosomal protein L24